MATSVRSPGFPCGFASGPNLAVRLACTVDAGAPNASGGRTSTVYVDTGSSANYGRGGTRGGPVYGGSGGGLGFGGDGGNAGTPIYVGAGAGPIYVGLPPHIDAGPELDSGRGASADGATDVDGAACEDGGGGPSGCGRRPPRLAGAPAGIGADLRGYFQEMARLEAASVPAFRRLRRELGIHGAPASLRAAALRAARDEVVHTRLGRRLAERFGGVYVAPRIGRTKVRSLEELAIDNATEGGVRETFGALVATWQSRAATDAVVRRIMHRVALDETRHAGLAIRVFEWTERRLSLESRRRVRDARRSCAADVVRELEWTPPPELVSIAGVPQRSDAQRLARAMTEALWS